MGLDFGLTVLSVKDSRRKGRLAMDWTIKFKSRTSSRFEMAALFVEKFQDFA
jgi:hypothetical protein